MWKKKIQEHSYTLILLAVLILLIAVMASISPYFFTWKNCRNILNQSAIYLVLSIGMTFVIYGEWAGDLLWENKFLYCDA